MTDEELKALVAATAQQTASNAQGIAALRAAIAEEREARLADRDEWRDAMRKSYEDMVAMLTQSAEEAARDRTAIQELIQAMFRHQGNGQP